MLEALGLRQLRGNALAILLGAVAASVAAGAAVAVAPPLYGLAGLLALIVIAAVAMHPPVGAYLLLVVSPLLAGLDRGSVVPVLRPHEAVALLVAVGLVAHLVVCAAARAPVRLRAHFGPIDRAILLFAVLGSIVPLIVMVVRSRPIARDDVLYALQLWKYYAVFVMIRASILTPQQVRRCLWIALLANAVVALIAIAQVLHVPFVADRITSLYVDTESNTPLERGSSTLSSSIAVGDVMVFSLAIAFGLLLRGDRRRTLLVGLFALFVFGTLATGQFSAVIALLVGLVAFGWLTRRLSLSFVALAPFATVGAIVLWPVIQTRLSGFHGGHTLPQSWQVRLDNLRTYYWPVLQDSYNWLTGVRPLARVNGPPGSGIQYIWIESGYIWALWTGGVAFVLAFLWFVWVAMRAMIRTARERMDAVGVAAAAAFTALAVNLVLMAFDPHITLRGSADLAFALLALASTARSA